MRKIVEKLFPKRVKRIPVTKRKFATIENIDLYGKTILLRADFNVPIRNGRVKDNFKIKKTQDTIKELLKQRCKVVIISHLGRPEGKANLKYSLKPVAKELSKLFPKRTIIFQDHCIGRDVKEVIQKSKQGQIILLENLRFYVEEEQRDLSFAHSLAELADYYIFDAFAVAHRKHASTTLLPAFLPSVAGFLVEDEIETIQAAKKTKDKSLWVIGGAKLDKLNIIKTALDNAEWIFVGGALCFSFLRAKGIHVGHSKFTRESVQIAKKILEHPKANKIILPQDFVCSNSLSKKSKAKTLSINNIPSSAIGLDLGKESTNQFIDLVHQAKQIIWNGPLGYTEDKRYQKSTNSLIEELQKVNARTICGGGETSELIAKKKARDNLTHVSTGGGASLALLSGSKLPALEALSKSAKKFKLL